MLAPEAPKILQHLADPMANKQQQQQQQQAYSAIMKHLRLRIDITLVLKSCPSQSPRIPKKTAPNSPPKIP
jgi:hypothetical protein